MTTAPQSPDPTDPGIDPAEQEPARPPETPDPISDPAPTRGAATDKTP